MWDTHYKVKAGERMIKQLSVFVENRPGSLMQVTSALTEAHINIRAVASFDTPEFGILRMVVDQPSEAKDYTRCDRGGAKG